MDTLNINYDDFNTNLCDGLQSILASSEMSDVTLAVEGKYFKAHQLILSMFSTYFRELFQVTPSRNTIFFMKNVKHRIMHNLLLFIYEGKVQIPSEDFQLFVDTGNELKIKGLTKDMNPKVAEISKQQVNYVSNIEHAINSAPSLKRATEPIKQSTKKHKQSTNEPEPSTSEASVSTLETNDHRRETKDFNFYGIQVKEEDTDSINVDSTEMYGLDDKTNELDGDEHNTIISKESVLPLASSQIDHPVIRETEESDIDKIQQSEDTEKNMALVDVGPTEIHCSEDQIIEVDDYEDATMNIKTELLTEVTNDLLESISPGSLEQPAKDEHVTATHLKLPESDKTVGIVVNGMLYRPYKEDKSWSTWRCCLFKNKNCTAMIHITPDGRFAPNDEHTHCKYEMRFNFGVKQVKHVYRVVTFSEILPPGSQIVRRIVLANCK